MNEQNRQVKIMRNVCYINKIRAGEEHDQKQWRHFNSTFEPYATTALDMAKSIARGYAFAPMFEGRRKKDNFKEAWHIALDFDSGDENSSLAMLKQHDLANYFASFGYTTPSHTPEHPKARLVFIFDSPITSLDNYERLYRALLWRFPEADKSTKDALRLFYGSKDCDLWENWSVLPLDSVAALLEQHEEYEEEQRMREKDTQPIHLRVPINDANKVKADKKRELLLSKIATAPNGQKWETLRNISRTFGGYVAGGVFTKAEVIGWLEAEIRARGRDVDNLNAAYKTIEDSVAFGMNDPLYLETVISVPSANSLLLHSAA